MTGRKSGFTLVEVLIASFAVVLGLVGMLAAFSAMSRTARLMESECAGLHFARQEMEKVRAFSFSAPQLSVGTHSFSGGSYVVSSSTGLTRQVSLSVNVLTPDNRTSRVTVCTALSSNLHL